MKFTSNNILSLLRPYRGRPYIQPENGKTYTWVSLLPDDPRKIRSDILHVCRLSEALYYNHQETDCHFVCICDRYLSDDEREDFDLMHNIILVEENRSVSWLLNLIQERFRELEAWESALKDVVISGGDYQQIFDISEHYLKNSLFALDETYRLVAHSKNYLSSDPLNIGLYETGYYTQEALKRFYDQGRLVAYQETTGPLISVPGAVGRFESITQWCRYDGVPLVQIVEVFSHSPMSAESEELFKLLMQYINLVFRREQERNQGASDGYGRFLREVIYGELTDPQKMNEAAKNAGFQITGHFDAYRIVFRDNRNVLIGRFVQELQMLLPTSKIIARNYEVSILNSYDDILFYDASRHNIEKILPLLQQHEAVCGVSAPFPAFSDLRHACRQAEMTLVYSGVYADDRVEAERETVFYYKDVYLYYLLHIGSATAFDAFYNGPYLRKLKYLESYDRDHNTELSRVLYWYLYYERRTTEAGKLLHMHRNTVMYHVQHITEMLDIDLEDYHTRQGILMTYHFLTLKKHIDRDSRRSFARCLSPETNN